MDFLKILLFTFLAFGLAGCFTLKTEHHITLDHNITIKVEKEVNDFVDGLTVDQFNMLMEWFSSVPKMVYDVDFTCSKCGEVQTQQLSGLQNFFV